MLKNITLCKMLIFLGTFLFPYYSLAMQKENLPGPEEIMRKPSVFAYDTTTQEIKTPNVFQNISINTNETLNGWKHEEGSPYFICTESAAYSITCEISVQNINNIRHWVEFRAMKNDEIEISENRLRIGSFKPKQVIGRLFGFTAHINAGDKVYFQFRGSSTSIQLFADSEKQSFGVRISKLKTPRKN